MSNEDIQALEKKIYEMSLQLTELRKNAERVEVSNYQFETLSGQVSLRELFGDNDKLLMIHNMGQGCRYCTLWGDGLNPFVSHLESTMAVAMVSKDSPELQRQFANSRGWRFRMASHGGGEYIAEQTVAAEMSNYPGAVSYEREGDKIYRVSACAFGPGDLYCSIWHVLGLAGIDAESWTPQYNYWLRPDQLEDGGENVLG